MTNAILITVETDDGKTTLMWEDTSSPSDISFLRRVYVQTFVEHFDNTNITPEVMDEQLDAAVWSTIESVLKPTDQVRHRMIHTIIIGDVAYAVTCDLIQLRVLPN